MTDQQLADLRAILAQCDALKTRLTATIASLENGKADLADAYKNLTTVLRQAR